MGALVFMLALVWLTLRGTGDLLSWRAVVEGQFRFDPRRGVDPADKAALLQSQAQQRSVLETELVSGARRLQTLSSTAST
jgi:DNA-binding helix-hairpin-helix protein with protein kinase domain